MYAGAIDGLFPVFSAADLTLERINHGQSTMLPLAIFPIPAADIGEPCMTRTSANALISKARLRFCAKTLIFLFATTYYPLVGAQQGEDCKKIKNAAKRLACFDEQQKVQQQMQMGIAEAQKKQKLIEEEEKKQQRERDDFLTSAKPVMTALQKLRSRVDVGVSYRDYSTPLADADYEIKRFLKSPMAGQRGEFDQAISKALLAYFRAGLEWNTAVRYAGKLINDEIIVGPDLLEQYPELSQFSRRGWEGNMFASYKKLLSVLWKAGGTEVDRADKLLNAK